MIDENKNELTEIEKAMERLNKYDYNGSGSAQEALWLLRDLKEIFTSKLDKKEQVIRDSITHGNVR